MTAGTVAGDETGQAVTAARVRAALAQLSAENRQAVTEIYFRRRSVDQTAEVLGVPAATVIARCFYGLHQLRDTMTA